MMKNHSQSPASPSCCRGLAVPSLETIARHALLAVCVVGFVHYGSTKTTYGRVSVQNNDTESAYLTDAGSFVTNDYVHVALNRSPFLPDEADFYAYARPVGSTDAAEWVQILLTTMAEISFPTNIPYANALSNDFLVGTSYVRLATSTNSVTLKWLLIPTSPTNAPALYPIRTTINH